MLAHDGAERRLQIALLMGHRMQRRDGFADLLDRSLQRPLGAIHALWSRGLDQVLAGGEQALERIVVEDLRDPLTRSLLGEHELGDELAAGLRQSRDGAALLQRALLAPPPVGAVADIAGEDRRLNPRYRGDGDLHRERGSVLSPGDQLERAIGRRVRARGQARFDLAPVSLAKVGRADEVGQLGADRLLGRIAERLLRGAVALEYSTLLVEG